MSSDMVPRPPGLLGSPGGLAGRRPSGRVSREIDRAVEHQYARGVVEASAAQADAYVSAVVVQSATFVTNLGMQAIGMLAVEERQLAAQAPHAVANLQAALDALTGVVAREVARQGQGWSR